MGWSYKEDNNLRTGDRQVAETNFGALKSFFAKFPHLLENDFYIAGKVDKLFDLSNGSTLGESYGGIYVPTLSILVKDGQFPKKFRGFAVGNAYLDQSMLGNSLIHFAYYHGLFDTVLWDELVVNCCTGVRNLHKCNFVNNQNAQCKLSILKVQSKISTMPLNLYNIYQSCNQSSSITSNTIPATNIFSVSREHIDRQFMYKHVLQISDELLGEVEAGKEGLEPPCMNFEYVEQWLNQKAVRDAMHIRPQSGYWSPCNGVVNALYVHEYTSMKKQFQYLLHGGLKALIYNGDVDMMCNFLGDQW